MLSEFSVKNSREDQGWRFLPVAIAFGKVDKVAQKTDVPLEDKHCAFDALLCL